MPDLGALEGASAAVVAVFVMVCFLVAFGKLMSGWSATLTKIGDSCHEHATKREERYAAWADKHAAEYRVWAEEMKDAAMALREAIGALRTGR